MLNKIKLVGRLLPVEIKEKRNDFEYSKSPKIYFSLLVSNPSNSITVLRCITKDELANKISKLSINKDPQTVEVKGYLRNEKNSRQIITRATDIEFLNVPFEEINYKQSNKVRLLGKVITDFKNKEEEELTDTDNDKEKKVISFKIVVPREGDNSSIFFCRVQGELIDEFKKKVEKGDVILVEGFLQTRKVIDQNNTRNEDYFVNNDKNDKIFRISSILCESFIKIDSDSSNNFSDIINIEKVSGNIEEIDFSKPKK